MKLSPYSQEWKFIYKQEAKKIKNIIGDFVIDIQHIGSTAIPNIVAKPIIDIVVMISSLDKAKDLIKLLTDIGYKYDEPASSSERYLLRKGDPIQYHLSLTALNVTFWHRQILFRNYLIDHPLIAKEYEKLKLKIIKKYPTGGKEYISEKSSFIQKVLELAEKDSKSGI